MSVVEKIPQIVKRKKLIRAAAYARVSIEKDASILSLSAQVEYYTKYIQQNPDWTMAGIYIDEAKTGTKDTRENFVRLIKDCENGLVDFVITKTVSRFARNTVDLLSTCRRLKELGIDVYFEAQNIHSISDEGELMLTLLASLAQEEARSDSENMRWRVRKNFEEGKPWNVIIYGYRYKNGSFEIEPREAAVVREIFSDYLNGLGYNAIAAKLNARSETQPMHTDAWAPSTIRHMLTHYIYTGNLLLQRFYNENYITKKTIINKGELPMYHAEDTHKPIISKETWKAVQEEMQRRELKFRGNNKSRPEFPFTGKILCDCCKKNYRRKTTATGVVWICSTYNSKGKAFCKKSKQIPETTLIALVNEALDVSQFSAKLFRNSVSQIVMKNNNLVLFELTDGSTIEKVWKDRSRSESWTPAMREQARRDRLRRKDLCQE